MNRNGCCALAGWRMATATSMRKPERVHTIQMYLRLGLTTEQIEEILHCTGTSPFPQPLPDCEEALLEVYQDKLQDVEHQMAVLAALHTRLEERIACLQRQLLAE
jgi:DNA-binding transcriptional MerR regulator